MKYLYTLLHGKLYRCPFIANAANLKAIPDNPANYVELKPNDKDIKKKIRRLIKVAKFFLLVIFAMEDHTMQLVLLVMMVKV